MATEHHDRVVEFESEANQAQMQADWLRNSSLSEGLSMTAIDDEIRRRIDGHRTDILREVDWSSTLPVFYLRMEERFAEHNQVQYQFRYLDGSSPGLWSFVMPRDFESEWLSQRAILASDHFNHGRQYRRLCYYPAIGQIPACAVVEYLDLQGEDRHPNRPNRMLDPDGRQICLERRNGRERFNPPPALTVETAAVEGRFEEFEEAVNEGLEGVRRQIAEENSFEAQRDSLAAFIEALGDDQGIAASVREAEAQFRALSEAARRLGMDPPRLPAIRTGIDIESVAGSPIPVGGGGTGATPIENVFEPEWEEVTLSNGRTVRVVANDPATHLHFDSRDVRGVDLDREPEERFATRPEIERAFAEKFSRLELVVGGHLYEIRLDEYNLAEGEFECSYRIVSSIAVPTEERSLEEVEVNRFSNILDEEE